MLIVLKILFLFVTAWMGPIIIARLFCKQDVGAWQFLALAAGITGFVYLQFLM